MFNSNYNIIHNDSKTGRTTFLLDLAHGLKNFGLKLFFLGCTSELTMRNLAFFDDCRITSTNEDYNNLKLIDVIKEITETRKYDFIIIDDIDYLTEKSIDALSKIKIKKIVTCLTHNVSKLPNNSNFYFLGDKNEKEIILDYIKSLTRDKKINSILK